MTANPSRGRRNSPSLQSTTIFRKPWPPAGLKRNDQRRETSRPTLKREIFKTSRLLEFCSEKELVNQTGHAVEQWPLVVLKELVDNAIDAAEEAGIAPVIQVTVRKGVITVADNGPGIGPETVKDITDYSTRTSSREAYVSPTRGAQGNALKTILAMPFVLDGGTLGETIIAAKGVSHRIQFSVDHVRQEPKITIDPKTSNVQNGTRIRVRWPVSALLKTGRCQVAIFTSRLGLRLAQSAPHAPDRLGRREDPDQGDPAGLAEVASLGSDLVALVHGRAHHPADGCLHRPRSGEAPPAAHRP
jgi:hypothetical protein